jgi:hypothetical protein
MELWLCPGCNDDIRSRGEQLFDMLAYIGGLRKRAMDVQFQVLAFEPAEVAQPFLEPRYPSFVIGIILDCLGDKYAHLPHALGLLRKRQNGPRRCRANSRNKLSPPHSNPQGPRTNDSTSISAAPILGVELPNNVS